MYNAAFRYICWAIIVFVTAGLFFVEVTRAGSDYFFHFNVWGDRDLWRGLYLDDVSQVFGPEINNGARLPGGMFYYLLHAIMWAGPNAATVSLALGLLTVLTGAAITLFCWREFGSLAAAVAITVFATSRFLTDNIFIWNPAFILPFVAAMTIAGFYYLRNARPWLLCLVVFCFSAALQIHGQVVGMFLVFLCFVALFTPRIGWRIVVAALACGVVPILPYLLWEASQGFSYTWSLIENFIRAYWHADKPAPGGSGLLLDFLEQSLTGIYRMTGDMVPSTPEINAANSWRSAYRPLAAVFDGFAVASLVVGIIVLGLRIPKPWARDRAGAAYGFIALLPVVALTASLYFITVERHLVSIFPAVMIATAAGAKVLFDAVAARSRMLLAMAFAALVLTTAYRTTASMRSKLFFAHPYPAAHQMRLEFAAYLKARGHYSFEDYVSKAGLLGFGENGLHLIGNRQSSAFAYASAPEAGSLSAAKAGSASCAAAALKVELGTDDESARVAKILAVPEISLLKPDLLSTAATQHLFIVFYKTPSGNCAKNMGNPYIPTAFEQAHLDRPREVKSMTVEAAALSDSEVLATIWEPKQPFPMGILLRRTAKGIAVEVHGRTMRGFSGLRSLGFEQSRLEFQPSAQAAHRILRFPDQLGDLQVRAPWFEHLDALTPGKYTARFIGNLKDEGGWDIELAKIEITDNGLKLDASAAKPAASGSQER